MSLASQIRTRPARYARERERMEKDGWKWLRRAITTWLWLDRNRSGAPQRNRLTKDQKDYSRKLSNQEYYQKNRERLTLEVRETRKMCPEVRDKWERNRRSKRAKEAM